MKKKYLKPVPCLLGLLVSLLITGCLKNKNQRTSITEPPTWDNSANWLEIQRSSTNNVWTEVTNGKKFNLQWSYQDQTKSVIVGRYQYNFSNLDVKIDTTGAIRIKSNQLSFINIHPNGQLADSISVAFTQESDSTIILENNTTTPAIAIRYKKLKTP